MTYWILDYDGLISEMMRSLATLCKGDRFYGNPIRLKVLRRL